MTAHPLAVSLIEHLRGAPEIRVLEFACGSGRNTRALRAAGFDVVAIDDRTAASEAPFADVHGAFAAAISTHGLLHGTPAMIAGHVSQIARLLGKHGVLYATFGSIRDARFGRGERIDASTFAPGDGDERGVAHGFFSLDQVRALLDPFFTIESLEEHDAGKVHWFAVATAR